MRLDRFTIMQAEGEELDVLIHQYIVGEEVLTGVTAWTEQDWGCSDYPTVKNGYGTPNLLHGYKPEPKHNAQGFQIGEPSFRGGPPYYAIPKYSEDLNLVWPLQAKTGSFFILQAATSGGVLIFRDRLDYQAWFEAAGDAFVLGRNTATAICKALLLVKLEELCA